MYVQDGRLIVSPSDLIGYLECPHLTQVSLAAANGVLERPTDEQSGELEVLRRRGMEHERHYYQGLVADGLVVTDAEGTGSLAERAWQTLAILTEGPDVVYQAAFFDQSGDGPAWLGCADFLRRVAVPSDLGDFSYEPEEAKLARRLRPAAVLQLCSYADQLAQLQGTAPELAHVVLGTGRRESFRLAEFGAYFRSARALFEAALTSDASTYPMPVEHCSVCAWRTGCDTRRIADDHLTLVPWLSSEQARKLSERAGITTVDALAAYAGPPLPGIGKSTLPKLCRQARLLVAARSTSGTPPYELLETAMPGIGLGALPEPDPGDLFYDIEGDPFVGEAGLEYLHGVGWQEKSGTFSYQAFWGHDAAGEKAAFEAFIDFVTERRRHHPGLHVYHYAPYEPTALGKLMGRYATREEEVDALFRAGVLVDLYQVVRQGICIGTPSYSLKKLEALYMPARTGAITDGGSSIVEYERWLESGGGEILRRLEDYNQVDCDSTRRLRDWLELRRPEYATLFGEPPRLLPAEDAAPEGVAAEVSENERLKADLNALADASDDAAADATHLLGDLLDWYRREDKPQWWQYFHRVLHCDEDDLIRDTEAIGGLVYEGESGRVERSVLHRYSFDPTQPFRLSEGWPVCDPASERLKLEGSPAPPGPGGIVFLDPVAGLLDLRRGEFSLAPHPEALIPGGPIQTYHQRDALRRLARSVLEFGMDSPGPYQAIRDLLLRRPPRRTFDASGRRLVREGEDPSVAAVRLGSELNAGCLAIQGPPGSGKTRTAARLVVELVQSGCQVGITANSHAVISNLLSAVVRRAEQIGLELHASQRADNGQALVHPWVTRRVDSALIASDLDDRVDVVAGTPWLFSRPELDDRLDCLVVDEAGQLSLANVCAVGTAARNLVLVGDPRQLAQPSLGLHPPGAGASALEHLLAGAATMPPERGVFLDHTHRLHPEICAFTSEVVYEGRLRSVEGCELQAVGAPSPIGGSGLRFVPVEHRSNRTSAPEEVEVVSWLIGELLGRNFTDRDGAVRPIALDDVLVVAPYNAQVALLGRGLPRGARVGTVDRFQGQEAPVSILSMTTSDSEEIPRGMDFLYSRERLNVAVSRAQALSFVVASPALLAVPCRTIEQLRLANALCRFVELGQPITRP